MIYSRLQRILVKLKKKKAKPHRAKARVLYKMNKDRNFITWMATKLQFGKRYRYSKNRKEDKELIARDKKLLELLDIKDDYEIPRIFTKLMRERWNLYDLLRLLLEGYILDDKNMAEFITNATEKGSTKHTYPDKYRKEERRDIASRESQREMFDRNYKDEEEKRDLFDVIDE